MYNVKEIQEEVYKLAKKIDLSPSLMRISTLSPGDGTPHLEFINNEYHYVMSERGSEISRSITNNIDELLYWIFSDLTFSLASDYELKHRKKNEDSRRQRFSKHLELLEKIDPKWKDKKQYEIDETLQNAPYDDNSWKRVEMCIALGEKGLSPDKAYSKACKKYPLP